MKKVIIILIILIILAGAGLYFGWVSIKPGYYGVAFSSITGIENYTLEAGKFYWLWQKLIPKHFKLYLIKKIPTIIEFKFSTTLPGSENLKDYGNFDIGIDGKIQYSIDFNTAKILISKGIIENQESYFKKLCTNSIQYTVSNFILKIFNDFNYNDKKLDYSILDLLKENIINDISKELSVYGIENFKLDINYSSIPQIDIYSTALSLYTDYLNEVYQIKKEELKVKSKATAKYEENRAELKHLEDIGILVEKYPNLLKYMYIEKLGNKINVVVLPEGKSGFPSITESERLPEISPSKKNFIPIPETSEDNLEKSSPFTPEVNKSVPENQNIPSITTPKTSNNSSKPEILEDKTKESTTFTKEKEKEKKWYDYLKFWKFIKKK